MLGRNKSQKASSPAPELPKGPTPEEIGLQGTVEEFREAFRQAKARRLSDPYGYSSRSDTESQRKLQKAAIQAFMDGRPENVQTMLAHPDEFMLSGSYSSCNLIVETLSTLTRGINRSATVILLALAKVPEHEQQRVLDEALNYVVNSGGESGYEPLIPALMKAGANANAELNDCVGYILAKAIVDKRSPSIIELLYNDGKGARFEDALFTMRTKNWEAEVPGCITQLELYEERITGQSMKETVRHLQENVRDLTERLEKLEAQPTARPVRKKAAAPSASQ